MPAPVPLRNYTGEAAAALSTMVETAAAATVAAALAARACALAGQLELARAVLSYSASMREVQRQWLLDEGESTCPPPQDPADHHSHCTNLTSSTIAADTPAPALL